MNKLQAQTSIKKINVESFSLNPSALIAFFEIDVSDLTFNNANSVSLFRFHNNIKLTNNSLFWQGNEYLPIPILAEGFELTSRGVLPTPTLTLHSDNNDGAYALSLFKQKIKALNYLIGAKVIRRRTFLNNLDAMNFEVIPPDLDPDPYAEFPKDIYFIDRKSHEDKYTIQFELSSIFDLQGLQLPNRLIVSRSCPWVYRGHGCNYEYSSRKTSVHGNATLPQLAPSTANDRNELIVDILAIANVTDRGAFQEKIVYRKGDSVYIEKGGIKYYFIAKQDNPVDAPPSLKYWVSDQCDKSLAGCRLRWSKQGGGLPFGGFPSVNRITVE
jgi:lambda family phage minor tail protein L